jgi:NADH:ubiquinone oxidoreductase subunit F (NADH-binding)
VTARTDFAARVLDPHPITDLDAYIAADGMVGLTAARGLAPDLVIDQVDEAGLRGRGGAGFRTGEKWRTVAGLASPLPSTVVVNAAEGEPGSFKDRAILRANPYRVLEGALIAARAVAADRVVVALKRRFEHEAARLRTACGELRAAGWLEGVDVAIVAGPDEYLFGEETALLEAIEGRPPFPRIAPPFRHGVDEVGRDTDLVSAATTELVSEGGGTVAPPTLANNVETLANVPPIIARGPHRFREVGTAESPGSIVVTVSGSTLRAGVAELPMGTLLRDAIETVGGGAREGRRLVAAVSGVANPILPAAAFDTPLTYEDMAAAGSGLGAAGFIVLDDADDPVAFAHGVARFLAVESCGQCRPCKHDGLAVTTRLDTIRRADGTDADLAAVRDRLATITDGARCNLAAQHHAVVGSVLDLFAGVFDDRVRGLGRTDREVARVVVAPIVDITNGVAHVDVGHAGKQPDWSFDATDSGRSPAERLTRAEG